jgi:uncharacterized Zn finger protein (UPF0148 family)
MPAVCKNCGGELGLFLRLGGHSLCSACGRKEREEQRARENEARRKREEARGEYRELLENLATSPSEVTTLVPKLKTTAETAALSEGEARKLHSAAFRAVALKFLEDDILSEQEEHSLFEVSEVFGITQQSFVTDYSDLFYRLVIARLNDGRLPELADPHIIAKKGEVVHAETQAALMKEVTLREFRGGYSGFSFRIAKGVRYHVGGARGRSVVTGTKLVTGDVGFLSVTSRRTVFVGSKKTVDLPYSKLVNLNVFTDGIQFHMENRTTAPLFKVENGEVIAATVNAAVQRLS